MAKTLYEYYSGKGQALPTVSARSADAKKAGISNYTGSASQNAQLLSYLQGSSSTKTTPKTSVQTPAPAGKVLGASTVASSVPTTQPLSKLEAMFGDDPEAQAQGSKYLEENVYNKPSINDFRERQPDESITDYAKRLKNEPFYLAGYGDLPTERPKTLTANEVRAKAKQYGLEGTGFDFGALAGLTEGDVSSLLSEKSKNLKGSVSALTSFSLNNDYFSPISSAKKLFDAFNVGIKSATNPWNTEKDKKTSKNKLLEDTSLQLSQLFDSPATFDSFYTGNSEFKKLMDSFQKAGVSPDGVKSRIVTKTPDNATIADPLNPNESLYKEPATPKVSTDNTLLKGIADSTNQQIADLAGIPEQQREFYFGDTGYFTKIRQDAELQLQELDKSYKQIERDTEADYQANVKRAELQAEQQLAEIEESRVDAKNYMTGMLAKLGALKTTGEAPASLQRLETKYQAMANNTKTALFNAKATLASEKAKVISTIQSEKLGKMSAIRSDITKSSFEVQKELMNLENESKKQINALISDFNKESLDLDKTALAEANKLKLEYQKQFYKTASGGVITGNTYGSIMGQAGAPKVSSQAQIWIDAIMNGQRTFDEIQGSSREINALRSEVQAGLNYARQSGTYANPDVVKSTDAINNLLQDKSLGSISGLLDQFIGGYTGDSVLTKNRYNQLMNTLLVIDRGKLKGQGAITDFETNMLRDSISSLSRGVNDSQFRQGLLDVRGILNLNSGYTVPVIVNGQKQEIDRNQYYDLVRKGTPVRFDEGEAKTPLSLTDIGVTGQTQAPETKVVKGVTYVRVNGGWKKQ